MRYVLLVIGFCINVNHYLFKFFIIYYRKIVIVRIPVVQVKWFAV